MVNKDYQSKPPKPLKIKSFPGLDIGPDELLAAQKADETLTEYWDLVDKPTNHGKPQFVGERGCFSCSYTVVNLTLHERQRQLALSSAHRLF